jgi:rRNA maturation protein Rpf1
MKETAVERRLIKRVKDAGGRCMKILPVERGFPDRLVLIDRAAKMGIKVYVLYSTEQVNEWVDARLAEVST